MATPDTQVKPEEFTPSAPPVSAKKSHKLLLAVIIGALFLIIIGIVVFSGYQLLKGGTQVTPTPKGQQGDLTTLDLDYYKFAEFKLQTLDLTPSVKSYTPKSDLSDVYYIKTDDPDGFYDAIINKELTTNLKQALATDQFAITAGTGKEFYPLYEFNRYNAVPQFVTVDAVMHTYHLMFDSILKNLEQDSLATTAQKLVKDMAAASLAQYTQYSADPELGPAAKRNVAFFAVAAKLFDSSYVIPDPVTTEVTEELAKINAHTESFAMSPVMAIGYTDPNALDNVKEDYTQYIVRGHYTKSEQLQNYFKAMMWLGRLTFLSKDKTTVQSALLITNTLKTNNAILTDWENLYAPINFFVGKADDLTYYEYVTVYDQVFGTGAFDPTGTKMTDFWTEVKKLAPPEINSVPIFDANVQPDRDKEITGFRFMGQRFTVDAMVFQNLIYRDVTEKPSGERKMFPTSLEVPAAMGSQVAVDLIKRDTNFYTYPNYESQMTKMQTAIAGIDQAKWTQNIYWSWMYTLKGMQGKAPAGYPDFMRTDKWAQKELNTYVSSWTELKHDTILYSKQAMAELGDMGPANVDDKGYVEPNIEVWRRLVALVQMTQTGLESRGMITATDTNACNSTDLTVKQKNSCNLKHLETVVQQLFEITKKELQEQALTDEQYAFIKEIGSDLETMFMNTLDPIEPPVDKFAALNDNPAMLIADVSSTPNEALEEATGYINNIYVLVPINGQLRIAKGGVYSQYEFTVSSTERKTDADWRTMLADNKQPAMLKWQQELITKP